MEQTKTQLKEKFINKFCSVSDTPVFVDNGVVTETYPLLNTKNGDEILTWFNSEIDTLFKQQENQECICVNYDGQTLKCPIELHKKFFCEFVEKNCNEKIKQHTEEMFWKGYKVGVDYQIYKDNLDEEYIKEIEALIKDNIKE